MLQEAQSGIFGAIRNSSSSRPCRNSARYENKAIELLFNRLPVGILLILNKTVLYYNEIAEEFYSEIVHTRFSGCISIAGGVLSSMFQNRNRNVWEYYGDSRIYTVKASKYKWDENEAFSVVISVTERFSDKAWEEKNTYRLSARQLEIAGLIMDGYTNKEIADELFLSVHTVNKHVCNIIKKVNVKNRVEAACRIFRKDGNQSVRSMFA